MYNRLDSILAGDRQMDRQTDGQTYCHGIVRAMHTRGAVKWSLNNLGAEPLCELPGRGINPH